MRIESFVSATFSMAACVFLGTVIFAAGADDLIGRFKATENCEAAPPKGYIRVLYRKYDDKDKSGGCGLFRANRLEAPLVLKSFDAYESHAPEVVYKSTGSYPLYVLRVVKGGCPPGRVNCQD